MSMFYVYMVPTPADVATQRGGVKCRRHITVPAVPTQEAIPEEDGQLKKSSLGTSLVELKSVFGTKLNRPGPGQNIHLNSKI